MDVAIGEALDAGKRAIAALKEGAPLPAFFVENLHKHG
jgi:hypothetical protein